MMEYDDKQRLTGISFVLVANGINITFKLPANWKGVKKSLIKQTPAKKYQTEEHAMRVCWRIIKDWIASQIALI